MSADSNDVCEQVTDVKEQEKIADDVTKDPECKKMVKKLLKLGNKERNTIVKMLKRGILDFEPAKDEFFYTKDGKPYQLEEEEGSDDPEEQKTVEINTEKPKKVATRKQAAKAGEDSWESD